MLTENGNWFSPPAPTISRSFNILPLFSNAETGAKSYPGNKFSWALTTTFLVSVTS